MAALVALASLTAIPAQAQRASEGHTFLEAVRDRDGTVATEMLNEPGSTIVNARDISSGETGLHVAAARRDPLWIKFLAQRGADPNIANKRGVTPLQTSVALGDTEGAEALIKAGAHLEHGNATGETPLILAVHRRDMAMLRMLLEKGADMDRADNSGRTARDYAVLQGERSSIVNEFEKADADRAGDEPAINYGPSL